MKTSAFILLFGLSLWASAQQNQNCPCCSPQHQAFDFWVGDWEVYDSTGQLLGYNTIQQLEQNCILQELYSTPKGYSGSSYNYYNQKDSSWHQVWIDRNGSVLNLKGNGGDQMMRMRSDLIPGKKIDWFYHQITWKLEEDQSVSQRWETFDKEGKKLSQLFLGIYRRKP